MQIEEKRYSLKRVLKVAAVAAGSAGFAFSVLFGVLPVASAQEQAKPKELPNAPGKEVVVRTCNACHAATVVLEHGQTRDQWEETITKMIGMGAQVFEGDMADRQKILHAAILPRKECAKSVASEGGARRARRAGGSALLCA